MTKKVNLPQEYFHCPELSAREQLYLIQKAQDSAKALVESARSSHGPVRWIEAGTHKGVQMYKGEGRNPTHSTEQVQYVCGASSIQATIEEVAAFMDVSTTPKFKAYVPHQHELIDGVVLYTLVPPAPVNQFLHQVTIKWSAAHVPSTLIKDRDFLTLECQDVFTDATGRRGWVRSYHSVKLPCCPDLQRELGFVRGSFYHTGYVFVESERRGWLDCIHTCQVNLKGNVKLPSSIYFLAMRRRIGSVAELGRTLQRRRLGQHTFLSDLELVPKRKRSRCHVCAAKFGLLTRKSRCRKCGEVMCGQCIQIWEVSLPKAGVKKVRVCATCACAGDTGASTSMPSRTQIMGDEISLLSSVSRDSSQHGEPDYEYHDHQVPFQIKSTIAEEPSPISYNAYYPSPPGREPPILQPMPMPMPAPVSRPSYPSHHQQGTHPSTQPNYPRRAPLPDPEPYRPIGFVHHSEYDHPRYENGPPPRTGPGYPSDVRETYRQDAARNYGLPPPPSHAPRHHSEYYRYPDEYSHYPPPPSQQPMLQHAHGLPSRRYASETTPRHPLMGGGGKPYPTHTSEETASSSSDSLTAHALERHTREMGRPGPITPHVYDYDRPVGGRGGGGGGGGAPPSPRQMAPHHPQQLQQPSHGMYPDRASYHHQNDYAPQPPPSQARDSACEREPSLHSMHSRHSTHSVHSLHSMHDYYTTPRSSQVDRIYADDAASHRSSVYSNTSRTSDLDADPHYRQPMPYQYQYQQSQQQPPSHHHQYLQPQRMSLLAPETLPLQEQVVPEDELMKSQPPRMVGNPTTSTQPQLEAPSHARSASPSPDQEAATALAFNAARLMQQQQEIQEQLHARALSFSSDSRFNIDDVEDDDDDEEQGGVDGLEDWSTPSPASQAMLNEFESLGLQTDDTRRSTTSDSYRQSMTYSLDSRMTFGTLDDSTHRSDLPTGTGAGTSVNEPEPEAMIRVSTTLAGVELGKLTVVQLYQKILELTKKQHAMEIDATARSVEKDAVALDLQALYKQLNEMTTQDEVAF